MAIIIIIVLSIVGVKVCKSMSKKEQFRQREEREEKREALFKTKQQELVNQYLNSPLIKEIIACLYEEDGKKRLPVSIYVCNNGVEFGKGIESFNFASHRIANFPKVDEHHTPPFETGSPVWALAAAINMALGGEYYEDPPWDCEDGFHYDAMRLKLSATRSF